MQFAVCFLFCMCPVWYWSVKVQAGTVCCLLFILYVPRLVLVSEGTDWYSLLSAFYFVCAPFDTGQ